MLGYGKSRHFLHFLNNHATFAQSQMFDAILICWSNFQKFDLILTSLIHLTVGPGVSDTEFLSENPRF